MKKIIAIFVLASLAQGAWAQRTCQSVALNVPASIFTLVTVTDADVPTVHFADTTFLYEHRLECWRTKDTPCGKPSDLKINGQVVGVAQAMGQTLTLIPKDPAYRLIINYKKAFADGSDKPATRLMVQAMHFNDPMGTYIGVNSKIDSANHSPAGSISLIGRNLVLQSDCQDISVK